MTYETDNVIVFGAGASYDAGIPLLRNFMQVMWEISIRNKFRDTELSEYQKQILLSAVNISQKMDGYHGRVNFDDRNIEEILSMLYFEKLENEDSFIDIELFNKAIATVIDVTCGIKYVGPNEHYYAGVKRQDIYISMWNYLFKWYEKTGSVPILLSLNYDLVLERSFLNAIHHKHIKDSFTIPFGQTSWNYHNGQKPNPLYLYPKVLVDDRISGQNQR